MTYRELIKKLSEAPDNRLDDHVTIYDSSHEYVGFITLEIADDEDDALDKGHLFLKVNAPHNYD